MVISQSLSGWALPERYCLSYRRKYSIGRRSEFAYRLERFLNATQRQKALR